MQIELIPHPALKQVTGKMAERLARIQRVIACDKRWETGRRHVAWCGINSEAPIGFLADCQLTEAEQVKIVDRVRQILDDRHERTAADTAADAGAGEGTR